MKERLMHLSVGTVIPYWYYYALHFFGGIGVGTIIGWILWGRY